MHLFLGHLLLLFDAFFVVFGKECHPGWIQHSSNLPGNLTSITRCMKVHKPAVQMRRCSLEKWCKDSGGPEDVQIMPASFVNFQEDFRFLNESFLMNSDNQILYLGIELKCKVEDWKMENFVQADDRSIDPKMYEKCVFNDSKDPLFVIRKNGTLQTCSNYPENQNHPTVCSYVLESTYIFDHGGQIYTGKPVWDPAADDSAPFTLIPFAFACSSLFLLTQ